MGWANNGEEMNEDVPTSSRRRLAVIYTVVAIVLAWVLWGARHDAGDVDADPIYYPDYK